MKKKFDSFTIICILGVAPWVCIPLFLSGREIWRMYNGNFEMFLLNILAIPFVILGVITVIRGVVTILFEKDAQHFQKYWKFALYIIANLLGFLAIVLKIALI